MKSDDILSTINMIQKENLDVRTVTMGINLLDCKTDSVGSTCSNIEKKILAAAGSFVETCNRISRDFGIPVVNRRISITPIAHVGAGFDHNGFLRIAQTLDSAAAAVGIDILGGFSAQVEKGMTPSDYEYFKSLPAALSSTERICASVNIGSTKKGINMDALVLCGQTIKDVAEATRENRGFGAAKFVVFCNQPGDNPFMAGAIHGLEEADLVLNVGVSGPGVIARAIERLIAAKGRENLTLDMIADEIKQTTFRVTRCGELIGREVSKEMGIAFGIVDLSLAPTPTVGDSVGEIFQILGIEAIGAPGSTAVLAMLNDAVKKGGIFASKTVGGLSGAFIPVMEDSLLAEAVANGSLGIEKLEAMTCVCSVGLDMIAIPGSVDADTISALIADEMAIGMINQKTTAARLIPVPGMEAGDYVSFGGLFGSSPVMPINNVGKSSAFIQWGGRIPAPIHSFKN
jgi:uncharacterized protein (UPF0210 family)